MSEVYFEPEAFLSIVPPLSPTADLAALEAALLENTDEEPIDYGLILSLDRLEFSEESYYGFFKRVLAVDKELRTLGSRLDGRLSWEDDEDMEHLLVADEIGVRGFSEESCRSMIPMAPRSGYAQYRFPMPEGTNLPLVASALFVLYDAEALVSDNCLFVRVKVKRVCSFEAWLGNYAPVDLARDWSS